MNFPTARASTLPRPRVSPGSPALGKIRHGVRVADRDTGSGTTLELARACAREVATGDQLETSSLLFLGGCALAFLAGCAVHVERFVAHWDSFESFVRAVLG